MSHFPYENYDETIIQEPISTAVAFSLNDATKLSKYSSIANREKFASQAAVFPPSMTSLQINKGIKHFFI